MKPAAGFVQNTYAYLNGCPEDRKERNYPPQWDVERQWRKRGTCVQGNDERVKKLILGFEG